MINLDDKKSEGTDWFHCLLAEMQLYTYFDSFGIEYTSQEVLNKVRDQSISQNVFRIQDDDSIICVFYCIALIIYMLAAETLLDYTNFFPPNDYKKNDKIICQCLRKNMSILKFRLKKQMKQEIIF